MTLLPLALTLVALGACTGTLWLWIIYDLSRAARLLCPEEEE